MLVVVNRMLVYLCVAMVFAGLLAPHYEIGAAIGVAITGFFRYRYC